MANNRLLHHYARLYRHLDGRECETTLQKLADLLFCTRRHMRGLLAHMQRAGWLEWRSSAGRGRQSTLRFLKDIGQLQQEQAARWLEQGRVEQAVSLLSDDPKQWAQALLSRLGRHWQHDRQVLGVAYYRPMPNLYPGTPLRRSERHLAGQIFNGLTRINEEKGEIEGDLAHHWEQRSETEWHFHLRPAIRWHDGRELTMDDIVATLQRLKNRPLFAHVGTVRKLSGRSLAIELGEEDAWLPWLLADSSALIVPADHAERPDFASHPVGTGPYRVAINDAHRLSLQAFDDYFGYRALLDQVDIWMVPELDEHVTLGAPGLCGLTVEIPPMPAEPRTEMSLEAGVYFLLCDARSEAMRDDATRAWLSQALSPLAIMQRTRAELRQYWVPAAGLLPRWHHCRPVPPAGQPPLRRLRIAFYERHPEYRLIATAIAECLRAHDVEPELKEIAYSQWERGQGDSDIWLGSVNFTRAVDYALPAWLLGMPLLRDSLSPALPVNDWLRGWRRSSHHAQDLAAAVVRPHWLLPLFHSWLSLKGPGQIEDFRLNGLGWFDFKSAWLRPDTP
ncbi:HTH-type transcriptional regulator SgrR [Paludibacterium paludis]|uniref:HTH-type transcriptional regulator SgrR n=1 Tax=Paludibacterium paludis TaxID=1225769 RepID=A0A918U7C5_9NEIS|nr:HTH-type transcriptional regulator SgrR [Paludibacterium paludis]GGY02702.1 HTH-type transcriptional regulator SgrR [Paludibacterium paludis]